MGWDGMDGLGSMLRVAGAVFEEVPISPNTATFDTRGTRNRVLFGPVILKREGRGKKDGRHTWSVHPAPMCWVGWDMTCGGTGREVDFIIMKGRLDL